MSMTRPTTWWPGVIAYQIGRVTTYTTLGLILGLIGSLLHNSTWLGGVQNIISIVAGIIIILLALYIGGWLPDPFSRFSRRITTITGFSRFINAATTTNNTAPWYSAGLINGLLPCGLVYAAISLSLTATTVGQGVAGMLLFGLGTLPAMLAVPALMRAVTPATRGHILKAGAVLLIIVGAITVARGTALGQQMHGEHNGGAVHEHHSGNALQELEADSYCVIPAEQAVGRDEQQPSEADINPATK